MKSKEIPRIPGIVNRSQDSQKHDNKTVISYHPFTAKTSAFIVLKVNMPVLTLNDGYIPCEIKNTAAISML